MKNKITDKGHTLFLRYREKTGSIISNYSSIKMYYYNSSIGEVSDIIYRIVGDA